MPKGVNLFRAIVRQNIAKVNYTCIKTIPGISKPGNKTKHNQNKKSKPACTNNFMFIYLCYSPKNGKCYFSNSKKGSFKATFFNGIKNRRFHPPI
jgi:hypothetical protein